MSQHFDCSFGAGKDGTNVQNNNTQCVVTSVPSSPGESLTADPSPISTAQITQLQEFHLCLVAHPCILVCTCPNCGYGLALVPLVKEMVAHVKQFHSYMLVDAQLAALKLLLPELKLEHPSAVELKKELLPVPCIPELAVSYDGRHCTVCTYSIKSKSAMNGHVQQHTYADGASKYHCNDAVQLFWESSQTYCCYMHVSHPTLVPLPLPAALGMAMSVDMLDDAAKAKVNTLVQKDQELLCKAGLLNPQIQPAEFAGNLSPWAHRLDWQMYWAGKPVTAIAALNSEPKHWPGAHCYGAHWIYTASKKCAAAWMSSLLTSSRKMQTTFHTHGPDASKPYSLRKDTVKKHTELWAHMLVLLFHLFFDGDHAGYYGKAELYAHPLGLDAELEDALLQLCDFYGCIQEEDSCGDPVVTEEDSCGDPVVTEEAEALLLQLSVLLVMQEPVEFGHTEQLMLLHLFLHLCISADGILKRYVHHNSHSASAHLQSLHCFGKVLAQDDASSFAFHWSKDLATITFGLEEIVVEWLQALLHSVLQQADQQLAQLCLLAKANNIHLVNLALVQDNIRNMQPGFSFANATLEPPMLPSILCRAVAGNTSAAEPLPPSLCCRASAAKPLLDAYSKEVAFDCTAAQAYFTIHDEFTKLLAMLIELSSSLPARGMELVQLQHTNMLLGPCNIFVHNGSIFTALPSNKGTGRQKIIPRFLLHAVGCLVVIYVCQVVPFVHLLYNLTVQPHQSSAMLLVDHAGKPWDTNTISKMLQSLCKQYISTTSGGLMMRTWHQLAVSIDCKLIRPKKLTADKWEEDHAHDLQAGHFTNTAQQHYGLDASMLHQLNQDSMTAMLEVSEWWHAFWQLRSSYQEKVVQLVPLHTPSSNGESAKAIHALKWQLDVFQADVRSIKQKLDHTVTTSPQVGVSCSRSAVVLMDICQVLFKVTGSQCTKMVDQAYALNTIHCRESLLIVVMATGSGKSVLFMAPLHWLPLSSVMVVVVLYIALMEDLLHQCKDIGIAASKWLGYQCADKVEGSALVFVAAENCYLEPFGLWIQSLQQQEWLAAVFFDECHVTITQVHFWPVMDKIKWLMSSMMVPLYFLTATLPPSMVASFKESLMLLQDGAGLIWAATNCKNISYLVKQVASTAQLQFHLQSLL